MESAIIFSPPSTGLSGILLSVLKDQNMKKINTILMYGEKFYQLHVAQRQLLLFKPVLSFYKSSINRLFVYC